MNAAPMIELKQVTKSYGTHMAVDNLSIQVAEGEKLIILGTSGCGKTTLLKMMNRLLSPDSGSIQIGGKDVREEKAEHLRRRIGYVLQQVGLFPHYTIAENIGVVPRLLGWKKERTNRRVAELMEKLRLPMSVLSAYPSALSGGQQQRVGLARALVADPPLLLMDEPFGALDNVTRMRIQGEFKDLDELQKKTMVMVTHDVEEAFVLADRICLMDRGRIMQIGTPEELLFYPANDFTSVFLKGQRLALELRVLRLADVDVYLQGSSGMAGQEIDMESTLWEAMEKLSQPDCDRVCLLDSNGLPGKTFGLEAISAAFSQYKSMKSNG